MKRWRMIVLPIVSAVYWGSCVQPDGKRIQSMAGWERDVRAAICGMCVVVSLLLLTSIGREIFSEEER